MSAYLRSNLCVWVGDNPPAFLDADSYLANAPGAAIGKVWNGSAFVAPAAGSELANAQTIADQADAALVSNLQVIADVNSFMAGPGAGSANLTLAQLSAFARQIAPAVKALAQQNNGVIRLLRAKLDGVN